MLGRALSNLGLFYDFNSLHYKRGVKGKHMLVIAATSGQLCNRLFQFAHFMAFCQKRNLRIVNLAFTDYAQYFDATDKKLLISFPLSNCTVRYSYLRTAMHKLLRKSAAIMEFSMARFPGITSIQFYDEPLNCAERLELRLNHRLIFISGWNFRNYPEVEQYADDIRRYFLPKRQYIDQAKQICNAIRKDSDVIIGLHIRRGDYKIHLGGKYYFEDEVYIRIIQALIAQFPGKKVKVLIASNDPLNMASFSCVSDNIIWNEREPIVDLMALAHCDYIVGPPSTFSAWASFYGKVPLLTVEEPQQVIDLNNASI
jgi:hypothetical protein